MDKFWVTIGGEFYEVDAADYQAAKYEAASRFRVQINLDIPLSVIVPYAKASLMKGAPTSTITTEELLKKLKESEEVTSNEL